MPTLMEMIGSPCRHSPGSRARAGAPGGGSKDPQWKNVAYAELGTKMIRMPQYKLIKNGEEFECMTYLKDPKENHNLARLSRQCQGTGGTENTTRCLASRLPPAARFGRRGKIGSVRTRFPKKQKGKSGQEQAATLRRYPKGRGIVL